MFRSIPTILTPQELLDVAYRRASRAKGRGPRPSDRARSRGVAKLNTVRDNLSSSLRAYVKAFPNLDQLPPFYAEMLDILVGRDALRHHLGAVDWAHRRIEELVRSARREVGRARTIGEVGQVVRATYGRISSVVGQVKEAVAFLAGARKELRRLPTIDPSLPTIVIAGAPNVGKSQLVGKLSTAKPEVAPYPFTTRGISVGHFPWRRWTLQVLDTPGLLDRPMEERNPMERQAIAALRHLAHLLVFLVDPTETCGYPLEYQTRLEGSLRAAFPGIPMIEVRNKADLGGPKGGAMAISALTGKNVERLRELVAKEATSRAPGVAPPWESGPRPGPSSPPPGPWTRRRRSGDRRSG